MAFSLMLRRTRPCIPRRTCKSTLGFNIMVHGIREIIPISSATSRSFFRGSNSRRLIRDSAIGTNNAIKPLTADFIASFDKMLFTAGTKNNDGADFSSALIDPEFVFSRIAKSHAFALHVPITFLDIALNRQYKFPQTNLGDAFEAKMINLYGTDWFTATFTHPITKEKFSSGIGQEINVEKRDDACLYLPIYQTAVKIVDGKVYYSGRKLAEHAAAARAIDCLIFREENAQQKLRKSSDIASGGTRLCLEDPYLSAEERESQEIDYETLLAQRKNYRKLKPFAFFAKAKAHLLHSPKTFLHDALSRVYGQMPSFNDGYQVQEVLKDGGRWYTGTFSHPATKEEFSSGICKEVDVEVKKSQCLRPPLHRSEVKVIGGKVYYDEPRLAEHAAAARAIDCLLLREDYDDERNGITRDETSKMYRLCLEDPYLNAKEQDSQQIDYDALVSRKNVKQQKIFTDFAKYQPFLLHRPKTLLHNALSKKYGPSGSSTFKDAFDVQAISDDSKWFTATFTHPISNEQFSSGIYKEISTDSWSKQQKQGCMLTPLHDHEVKFWDGKVYYKEPAIAEIAAAARAIDCMSFREKYDDERVGLPRDEAPYMVKLCLEDPYLSANERKSQIIDYDALMAQRRSSCTRETSCEVDAGNDYLHGNNPSLGDAGNVVLEAPTTSADSSNDLDYNDDDFIIQVISPPSELSSGSSSPWKIDKQLSTMERIVEIWADTTEPEKADTTKMAIKPAKDPQSSFSLDVPVQEKIDSILAWYKRVDRRPQTYEQASALALVCNKILTALGNSNCSLDIVPVDIEKDAKGILDKIISLSLTFSGIDGESSFLDAETLNAYMYCLSRSDPSSSAESALGLLDSMVTNENFGGVALPSPNLGTYNAVMLLFSMVDGIDAQTGVNSVYSRLEVASLGRIDAQNLRPDKDTFKILLGSNSKKNNRFCVDTAKVWMKKIMQLSDDLGDAALISDVDIYNAAIAKHEKNLASDKYSPAWLSFGQTFDGRFRSSMEDDSKQEALGMEEWLLDMERNHVHPSIETYEAIIQAWIETGTLDGLLRAESWASRAVLSASDGTHLSVTPRLKTFHPILAAWALCGSERAPDRVKEWINQLTALSASSFPQLKPGLDILAAQIIAWRQCQHIIVEEVECSNENRTADDVKTSIAAAQNCTEVLTEILANKNRCVEPLDACSYTPIFSHVLGAWGAASRSALLLPPDSPFSDPSLGVDKILNTLRVLDTIDVFPKAPNIDGTNEAREIVLEHQEPCRDCEKCILQCIGDVYIEALDQLRQIDVAANSNREDGSGISDTCFFLKKVSDVEMMLRQYEFHSRRYFSYNKHTSMSIIKSRKLYKEVLRGCMGVTSPADYGHVVRICSSIMGYISWKNKQFLDSETTNGSAEDITDLYIDIALVLGDVVLNPYEKKMALTKVYDRASQFFHQQNDQTAMFATVDQASIIGAMRKAMGDSEMTESFLSNFDSKDRPFKRRRTSTRRRKKIHTT